jgi:hypothetical protein
LALLIWSARNRTKGSRPDTTQRVPDRGAKLRIPASDEALRSHWPDAHAIGRHDVTPNLATPLSPQDSHDLASTYVRGDPASPLNHDLTTFAAEILDPAVEQFSAAPGCPDEADAQAQGLLKDTKLYASA